MDVIDPGAVDVNELFQEAHEEGTVSQSAMVSLQLTDLNQQIHRGLAINLDDITADEMVLLVQLIDDSGSIRMASNAQAVRDGHNQIIQEVLRASRGSENVMVHTRYLNPSIDDGQGRMTDVLFPFCLLDNAVEMDTHNYNPTGGTPLCDQVFVTLATVQAEMQRFTRMNVPCRSIMCVITDGADVSSRQHDEASIRPVVESMLAAEMNIICAMGIQDDIGTDFTRVFGAMGIPPEWILTPSNTNSDIRRAFGMVSRSVARASQTATGMTSSQIRDTFQWD